jgi:uncharacterized protein
MAAIDDRSLDNLIRASEDLIRDLGPSLPTGGSGSGLADSVLREIEKNVVVPLEPFVEPVTDGSILISISKDEMLAHANFSPPTGEGKPLPLETVQRMIEEARVTAGVDWEGIKSCILTCNEERTEVREVVIARGRRPIDEIPPHLILTERLVTPVKKETSIGPRVDFKELSLFTLVKKGDELALLMPKQDGAMGATVRGSAVAYGKQPIKFPRPGKNTAWDKGRVIASCDGRFQITSDSFWVDEVLDILGDIDLRVGNIDFPGNVVIRGEIRDGFTVKAGKSILVRGCIGAAHVECGGDLVTEQGIVGKERAEIRVGGATEAKFIEGCALDSAGPVRVRTSIVNSNVHTRGRVEMGERGIIVGGIMKAQNGVSAAQIGTAKGPRTEIHCGIDFKVEQKLAWIRDRNIALAFKLKEIDTKMKASAKAKETLAPLREKMRAAIHQLNENARALVMDLDRNDMALVSVRGDVFPGTYIETCHVSHFVTRPLRFVSFKLDKEKGKLVELKWEKGAPA